jgi:RimJ/RimL family protein N-acetyltransferase
MLTGEKVVLRHRTIADSAILDSELHNDVETMIRAAGTPWRPQSVEQAEAWHRKRLDAEPDESKVNFAVEEIASGELAGEAQLWGIDPHNRMAHLGYTLRAPYRGRGLGTDVIAVLCDYGFRIRGLHRLQIETLAENEPSLRAAQKLGFAVEGRVREDAWIGYWADEIILGQLAGEWFARNPTPPAT